MSDRPAEPAPQRIRLQRRPHLDLHFGKHPHRALLAFLLPCTGWHRPGRFLGGQWRRLSLDMRIVHSSVGRALMEARRTPDGRAATPTLIILNEDYEEVGCWIERPSPLQEWALGEGTELDRGEFVRQKMSWYQEDGGQTTVTEVVDIMEAASKGQRICGG